MSSSTASPLRAARLDALRGLAVVWMTAFHFCFDLDMLGFWQQQMLHDPFWTTQRSMIVAAFLFCAGAGQALALRAGQGWPRFWRRWRQIVACAALVSIGSWWLFPASFIYFGVLHGLAVMLLLLRLAPKPGRWLWPAGAIALALPWLAATLLPGTALEAAFNGRPLNILGLVTARPVTEDYVPLFPWLGVLCWGMAVGDWLASHRAGWLDGPVPGARVGRALAWMGRHSLPWYMLHQPLMMGALTAWGWMAQR